MINLMFRNSFAIAFSVVLAIVLVAMVGCSSVSNRPLTEADSVKIAICQIADQFDVMVYGGRNYLISKPYDKKSNTIKLYRTGGGSVLINLANPDQLDHFVDSTMWVPRGHIKYAEHLNSI